MPEPKVLILDIETSPSLAYVWGLWKQDIQIDRIIDPTRVMCFAAKWLGDKKVQFYSEFDFRVVEPEVLFLKHNEMILAAWDLLDKADAVVHYNGQSFDIPHLYREFMQVGLGPPSPFAQVDLLKAAKKARWMSNKLQWVSTSVGLEGKFDHEGFSLWSKCLEGDAKAWRQMRRYNKQDVVLTEELYLELLPWAKNVPNYNLWREEGDEEGCPKCGSASIQKRGFRYTQKSRFQKVWCSSCKGWSSTGKRDLGADLAGVS